MDQGQVQLAAQVRDRQFQPAADAHVTAHIVGPDGHECADRSHAVARHAGPVSSRLDRGKTWLLSCRSHGGLRRQPAAGAGQRRADLPARRWRRRKLSHRAKPASAGAALHRRPAAATGSLRSEESPARHLLLRGRHLRPQHKELWDMPIVFLLLLGAAHRRVAASPQVGCRMKRSISRTLCFAAIACLRFHARAASYYVIVAGLGGEPDYEQRFTAAAKDLDQDLQSRRQYARMSTRSPERRPRRQSEGDT